VSKVISLIGKVYKDGKKLWLIELPFIDVMTQGRSREDAFDMLIDYLICDSEKHMAYTIKDVEDEYFIVECKEGSDFFNYVLDKLNAALK
jgi:hypothetical protein